MVQKAEQGLLEMTKSPVGPVPLARAALLFAVGAAAAAVPEVVTQVNFC
jgi:hypothetical protein